MAKTDTGVAHPRTRMLWTATALAGGLVLGLSFWLAGLLPVRGCTAARLEFPPLTAFQAAKSAQDIWAVFGASPSACRHALIASMDAVNWVDLFAYVPSLALLALGFVIASRRPGRLVGYWVGLGVIALTTLGDVIETSAQLVITARIPDDLYATQATLDGPLLTTLIVGNMTKVMGWPVVFIAAAWSWLGRNPWANLLAAFLLYSGVSRYAAYALHLPVELPEGGLLAMLAMAVTATVLAVRSWLPGKQPRVIG